MGDRRGARALLDGGVLIETKKMFFRDRLITGRNTERRLYRGFIKSKYGNSFGLKPSYFDSLLQKSVLIMAVLSSKGVPILSGNGEGRLL